MRKFENIIVTRDDHGIERDNSFLNTISTHLRAMMYAVDFHGGCMTVQFKHDLSPADRKEATRFMTENHGQHDVPDGDIWMLYEDPELVSIEITYEDYLKTKEWQKIRTAALKRADFKCQLCGARHEVKLNVHHNNYKRIGKEEPSDLIVLCEECHKEFHRRRRLTYQKEQAFIQKHGIDVN